MRVECCSELFIAVTLLQEVKRLGRAVMLSSVAVFGGSGVANQISELKRGTEVRT
jgi:ATP-dependent RNA helicase DDX46/PRP5